MKDPDVDALERLVPILGDPECAESWVQGFSGLVCHEARPAGSLREPFGPNDIADVISAACCRGNGGFACALLRLNDGSWATIDIETDDTLGEFIIWDSRGYVSRELSDVVLYGLGNDTREHLRIPNDVDRAIAWVRSVERNDYTPRSVVLDMLGDPDLWRGILNEFADPYEENDGGSQAQFAPEDIIGVVAVGAQPQMENEPGWAAAVVRLRDSWGSLEAEIHRAAPGVRSRRSSKLAPVAWWGISEPRRQSLGFPSTEAEFRAWATFVEQGYPATAHRYHRTVEP